MIVLIVVVLFCTVPSMLSASASDSSKSRWYSISISGEHLYQGGDNPYSTRIDMPDYIRQRRSAADTNGQFSTPRDNPLYHGAQYVDVQGRFHPADGIHVWASIITEHRGASYGVFNENAIRIVPQLNAELDTSFALLGSPFRFHASAGNERSLKLYEGLTIYNVETQGSHFFVEWHHLRFGYHKIGDLMFSYAMGIDDVDDWSLALESYPIDSINSIDVRVGTTGYSQRGESNTNYSAAFNSKRFKVYAQYSVRDHEGLSSPASLLGIDAHSYNDIPGLSIKACLEWRRYRNYFNDNYSSSGSTSYYFYYYRDYPLYLFRRPFSQWAIFTEYQDKDQEGLTARFDVEWNIISSLFVICNLDVNRISSTYSEPFVYTFYDIGVAWQPLPQVRFMCSMTTKGMDLTRNVPGTFYMYDTPLMQLSCMWKMNL